MSSKHRRLRVESLEPRRVLSGAAPAAATVFVHIPDIPAGQPNGKVVAPVNIDNASGIRGAEVRIQYDSAVLHADSHSLRAGSVWPQGSAAVVANVNDASGSIVAFVFAAEGLAPGSGSLLEIDFALRGGADVSDSQSVDLVRVRLNEGAIEPRPEPTPGPDSTDGHMTVAGFTRSCALLPATSAAAMAIGPAQPAEQRMTAAAFTSTEGDLPSLLVHRPAPDSVLLEAAKSSIAMGRNLQGCASPPESVGLGPLATTDSPRRLANWIASRRTATHVENHAQEDGPSQVASAAFASLFIRPKRPASVGLASAAQSPWL